MEPKSGAVNICECFKHSIVLLNRKGVGRYLISQYCLYNPVFDCLNVSSKKQLKHDVIFQLMSEEISGAILY